METLRIQAIVQAWGFTMAKGTASHKIASLFLLWGPSDSVLPSHLVRRTTRHSSRAGFHRLREG
jgi:hypothetical protein